MSFALKRVAVLVFLVTADLLEQPNFTGVTHVAQDWFQHRATRHAFCPKECCSAAVFGDCTLV